MTIRILALVLLLAGCAEIPRVVLDRASELSAALNGAYRVRVEGPAVVSLAPRLTLQLQPGIAFVPPAEGARLLRALGKPVRAGLLGVVVADSSNGGTESAALYARGERGADIPELDVAGWESAPALGLLAPRQ